jgi:glutamate-1-semialdehyde 2,1-aminomutase
MSSPSSPRARADRYLAAGSRTASWHARARQRIPGGTSRLHYVFEPYPIVASSGRGCRLTDVDGDVRIDCLNNMTALIHGHCDPDVTAAVTAQLERGVSFSEPAEAEVALAEMIAERVPSVERIHFRSSGTEAVMMAIKLARAFTGRDRIAKFEGGYHGYYDYVQMSVLSSPANWGDAHMPRSVPSSGGLTSSVGQDVLTLPFNDPDGVERLLGQHGPGIAALLVEPLSNRSGMALPAPGFFEFLRAVTRRHGIVLVFDEVIAYRVGMQGAQGRYGVSPDLSAFGKIIGGGLPIGAVGGRADILDQLDPAGAPARVISGGTYSGNPLSAVAGAATLQKLTPAVFARLDSLGTRMRNGINAVFRAARVPAQASGDGSLFQVVPTDRPIRDYRSVPRDAAAVAWLDSLHRELLAQGVIVSNRGLACLSTAMAEADVDECLSAFEGAVGAMRR